MSKLEDYYRLFDMFNGKLTDEQKKILEGLEDQLIAEEILPAISKSVAPVLTTLRRSLTLIVDYDAELGVTVKTTRGEVLVKEQTAKKYQLPPTGKVGSVAEASPAIVKRPERKYPAKRAPSTGLCVWISESEFIQENKAAETFAKAIAVAGAERVAALNLKMDRDFLVSKKIHPLYSGCQYKIDNGYLVNTHSNTETKKRQLLVISKALDLGWRIDIVK